MHSLRNSRALRTLLLPAPFLPTRNRGFSKSMRAPRMLRNRFSQSFLMGTKSERMRSLYPRGGWPSVQFHPALERRFHPDRGLHLLQVGVFDVRLDFEANRAQRLGSHLDPARRVRLALDVGMDFLRLIENLGGGEVEQIPGRPSRRVRPLLGRGVLGG